MYATPSPHGSSAAPHAAAVPQHPGHPPATHTGAPTVGVQQHVAPPAVHDGGAHGATAAAAWNPMPAGMPVQHAPMQPQAMPVAQPMPQQPVMSPGGETWMTGAYELSGDPSIDRMIRLEAALKRFGSPF